MELENQLQNVFLEEGYEVIIAARTKVSQGEGLLNKAVFFKMDVRDEKAHIISSESY